MFHTSAQDEITHQRNYAQYLGACILSALSGTLRLAIVPGYSYYNFITSPEAPQIIDKFLADPLTNPPSGASSASQAPGSEVVDLTAATSSS